MFKENKYTIWYNLIIAAAILRQEPNGYYERHHILPKALGGDNSHTNIVKLTAREHYLCHRLLTKMVISPQHREKMAYASWQQTRSYRSAGGKVTGQMYEAAKRELSRSYKGRKKPPFSDEWKANMSKSRKKGKDNPLYGIPRTEESKMKMSKNRQGKLLGEQNHFYGKTHSDEAKAQIGEASRNRERRTCHCGRTVDISMFTRWHGERCRSIK